MLMKIDKIIGSAIPLKGNDIDTDRIIPARFLKCVVFDGLGHHVFEDDRREEKSRGSVHPFDHPEYKKGTILVVNNNFGCGSSREHAPQALKRFGIKAIIGESFAEIFFGNCLALGVPCLRVGEKEAALIQTMIEEKPSEQYTVDISDLTLKKGKDVICPLFMQGTVQEQFLSGTWDVTGILLENQSLIKQVASRLPYLNWA
ncbi:MAG: 3-isopropylmalate dehydratase small subunit [Candidatus Aureabacteria bacterium]|nr:3-isopropylmalate dehydratase small subunit [Candidatus Auribacterota bacterium]